MALKSSQGGGPRVVVSTAAFHARVRGSVPGLGGLKETKMFLPHPRVKVSIVGSLRDREVACSASDRQGSNFESCVWRTVSSQSSLTILRRFSWPSLAYMCAKVASSPIHFIFWSLLIRVDRNFFSVWKRTENAELVSNSLTATERKQKVLSVISIIQKKNYRFTLANEVPTLV